MRKDQPPFPDASVDAAFAAFPKAQRDGLFALRSLIYETAAGLPEVGALEETLKWGQPSYLTPETKSGSTLRLGVPKTGGFALYAHCQTSIIADFRDLFPDEFTYEGNRAVHFGVGQELPSDALALLISRALTYHLKRKNAG